MSFSSMLKDFLFMIQGHFIGDTWHPNKCTTCECTNDGKTVCSRQLCSETVCAKGMKSMEVGSDGCCKKFICGRESSVCKPEMS